MFKYEEKNILKSPPQRLKYIFNPLVNLKSRGNNIMQNILNIGKKSIVEEVEYRCDINRELKIKLRRIKIDTIKQLLYTGRSIPQIWSLRPDYKDLVREVLVNDENLRYYLNKNNEKVKNGYETEDQKENRFSVDSCELYNSNFNYQINSNIRENNKNQIKEDKGYNYFLITSTFVKPDETFHNELPSIINTKSLNNKRKISSIDDVIDNNHDYNKYKNGNVILTDPEENVTKNIKLVLPIINSKNKLKLSSSNKQIAQKNIMGIN